MLVLFQLLLLFTEPRDSPCYLQSTHTISYQRKVKLGINFTRDIVIVGDIPTSYMFMVLRAGYVFVPPPLSVLLIVLIITKE